MNLPNGLTVSRIFLVPLLLVVLLTGKFKDRELWGFIVFPRRLGDRLFRRLSGA